MSKQKSRQPSQNVSSSKKAETNGMAKRVSVSETLASEADTEAESQEQSAPVERAGKSGTLTAEKARSKVESPASGKLPNVSSTPSGKLPNVNAVHRPAGNKAQSRDAAKYERRQQERQRRYLAEKRARRTRILVVTVIALVVIIAAALSGLFIYNSHNGKASVAPTPTPFQEAIFDTDYPPVDNVYCDQLEQSVEHIHAHLSIYFDGQSLPLPQNIGIAANSQSGSSTCYYWLHTHDTSGVIHIESPVAQPYTLGQFIDLWDQQFQSTGFPTQLLQNTGWKIWVDGKVYNGALASVDLNAHSLITIAYGDSSKVKPDTTYNWGTL